MRDLYSSDYFHLDCELFAALLQSNNLLIPLLDYKPTWSVRDLYSSDDVHLDGELFAALLQSNNLLIPLLDYKPTWSVRDLYSSDDVHLDCELFAALLQRLAGDFPEGHARHVHQLLGDRPRQGVLVLVLLLNLQRKGLFNDALNRLYLCLIGVRHMVKDHSDSEKRNPLPPHLIHRIDPSWGGPIELFRVPASAPRLV